MSSSGGLGRYIRFTVAITMALLVCIMVPAASSAAMATSNAAFPNLLPGFAKTQLLSGLKNPTVFAFAPNGDIYIGEQGGQILIYRNGALLPTPLVTLNTDGAGEKGLLGLAFDPSFTTNGYIYASYTTLTLRAQLSRFTVQNGAVNLGTEKILLKGDQMQNTHHSGNDVRIGPDGKIWWSVGDNVPTISNGQALTNIYGKILRLNLDGTIPSDNPFLNIPGAVPAIYAYGLRNPYRFTFLPDGRMMTEDTGSSYWEELNTIQRGGNYGWPFYEGNCGSCGYINPAYAYGHLPTDSAASALAAYSGSAFPSAYNHVVFVGDYVRRDVEAIAFDPTYTTEVSRTVFDSNAGTIADLQQGPDGNLYSVGVFEGTFSRISAVGPFPPTSVATATPNAGVAPLQAQFSSAGSSDPYGLPLTYSWAFGDGTPSSNAANPAHLYGANGTYTAALTVSDGPRSATSTTLVVVGHTPPTAAIDSPAAGASYRAGDTIAFSGSASDSVDGVLPASAYTWQADFFSSGVAQPFYLNEVAGPFFGPVTGVTSGSFFIPRDLSNTPSSFYRITLTVTDSLGLTTVATRDIHPQVSGFTASSNVTGGAFVVDGTWHTQPYTAQDVVGVQHVLTGVPAQTIGAARYRFRGWSDGAALADSFATQAGGTTHTANLDVVQGTMPSPWQSVDVGSPTLAGSADYSAANSAFYVDGAGTDVYATNDQFHYVEQPLNGDGAIIARVRYQTNSSPSAKAGVMIKQSATAGATYVDALTTPNVSPNAPNINGVGCTANGCAAPLPPITPAVGSGLRMQYPPTGSQAVTSPSALAGYASPNEWLKLSRVGNAFTSWYSTDGLAWTKLGSASVAMNASATIGLFVSSHNSTQLSSVAFDHVQVTASGTLQPLPAPWVDADIGAPALGGSAGSNGSVFTVNGAGADIYGTADQFNYAYQPLAGDGSVSAHVTSQTNTNAWAKAGVMLRADTTPGSPNYAAYITPGNGISVQVRTLQGGTTSKRAAATAAVPTYLKVTRAGTTFSAYSSSDGVTWTLVPNSTMTLSISGSMLQGLAVTSHNSGSVCTVTMDTVVAS